jgi:hypothetical protein
LSWVFDVAEPRPQAAFIVSTLSAIFFLTERFSLKIPGLELDEKLNFNVTLLEISRRLKQRQIAYRLMVIEKATGKEFFLSPIPTDKELSSINFVYHAIADRTFVWPAGTLKSDLPASKELLTLLDQAGQAFRLPYSEEHWTELVLDQSIDLGKALITIPDAIVKNPGDLRQELALTDGHPVKVSFESLSGQVIYEFPDAPRLPDTPWDSKIQAMVDIESDLDNALIERYHALAAATLAGLTEEEKAAVTVRPELDEDAFLIDG